MITEQARVVKVGPSGELVLEVQRQTACGNCEVQGACGVGAIGRLLGVRKPQLTLPGNRSVKTGDIVTIGIPEGALVKTSLAIYLLPLIALLILAVIGDLVLGFPEWFNVIFSLITAAFCWYLLASRITTIEVQLLSPQTAHAERNAKDVLLS